MKIILEGYLLCQGDERAQKKFVERECIKGIASQLCQKPMLKFLGLPNIATCMQVAGIFKSQSNLTIILRCCQNDNIM